MKTLQQRLRHKMFLNCLIGKNTLRKVHELDIIVSYGLDIIVLEEI